MLEDYFEPVYFFHFAKELLNHEINCEFSAIERTIIDRLYYAVFLSFRDFLSEKYDFFPVCTGDDHKGIINFIKKNMIFNDDSHYIANSIHNLKINRGSASYSLLIESPYTILGKISLDELFKESEYLLNIISVDI